MLPVPTVADLADFTGRPVSSYGDFAVQALTQATLTLQIVTHMTALPDDPDLVRLANYAIMELADRIFLEQPYALVKTSPFQTETIGSYSYSKVTSTAKVAATGGRTGLFWWDLAVEELLVPGNSLVAHGSVQVMLDGLFRRDDGQLIVMDAAQEEGPNRPPYIRIS